MLKIPYRRLTKYLIILMIGMSLIIYGLTGLVMQQTQKELSDEEIIQRAKDLGMVELKEKLKKN